MLKSFTFGCGQGATKAMICCIEKGFLDKNNCCVVNSTVKDIPLQYQDRAIVISDDPNAGCGKVRGAAKNLMVRYLKKNPNVLNSLIDEDVDYVNIIATTEGASGSGSSVVLARYIKSELGIPVIITLITGFETDTRGLLNTIEYFKDLEGGDFVINTISNKKVLSGNTNVFNAEKKANEEIATYFKILTAQGIIDSDQNIDDTDHYKIITNPGMMFITETTVPRLKNSDQFDQLVGNAIDYTNALDFKPTATKIGVYMNISDSTLQIINTNFDSIKSKLCNSSRIPEFFVHRQYDDSKPEFVRIIASGMNLPKDELEDMYKKYQTGNVDTSENEDDFFSALSGMETSGIDNRSQNKSSVGFFDQFNDEADNEEEATVMRRSRRKRASVSSLSEDKPIATESSTSSANNTTTETVANKRKGFTTKKSQQTTTYSEDSIDKF